MGRPKGSVSDSTGGEQRRQFAAQRDRGEHLIAWPKRSPVRLPVGENDFRVQPGEIPGYAPPPATVTYWHH